MKTSKLFKNLLLGVTLGGIASSCAPPEEKISSERGVIIQALRGASDLESAFVGFDFIATDSTGGAIACDDAGLEIGVEVSFDNGTTYAALDASKIQTKCGTGAPQIAMVLDNSGSQNAVLETTKSGARSYMSDILARGGKASVIRVSTQASEISELSDDQDTLNIALDGLFVNRGWTALYDGIRAGNETLGKALAKNTSVAYESLDSFCNNAPRTGILVFTNGEDNNSSDENEDFKSDGINTSVEDLKNLRVQSTKTPIYSIGLGPRVNENMLRDLSSETGGRHIQIQSLADLGPAFDLLADYPSATTQVCGELSSLGCGTAKVRISYNYVTSSGTFTDTRSYDSYIPCPIADPTGKVATILLTLSNPSIPQATSKTLAKNAVNWVAPNANPKVLVIRDDNHHNEFSSDTNFIYDALVAEGFDADFFDEPAEGTKASDFGDYDVIWYSNPGWPQDELSTFRALLQFSATGKGIVMQGDDISWAMGRAFPTRELTHLEFKSNGTRTCNKRTDNNSGEDYLVSFANISHPILAGLENTSFFYGDDIDHTVPSGHGEEILAGAILNDDANCQVNTPVVVAYDPSAP